MRLRRATATPKPAKRKGLPVSAAERFVITIGDEGAILLYCRKGEVVSRHFAAKLNSDDGAECVRRMQALPDVPVRILLDTADQSYIQQTLPPVTSLSVQKIMRRRLLREFPNEEIRGAITLGREKTGRKDWHFLMLAVHQPEHVKEWIDRILSLKNPCEALAALPVETTPVIKALLLGAEGAVPKGAQHWQFLITVNKVSGIRQTILKQGKIIFTRLSQAPDDPNPDVLAGTIEQEASSTMEYLKRLSLRPGDKLSLLVIAANDVISRITPGKLGNIHLELLSPHQAAERLSMQRVTESADRFGDVVLAAAIARLRSLTLPLTTLKLKEQIGYFQTRKLIHVVSLLVIFACLAYTLYAASESYRSLQAASTASEDQRVMRASIETLQKEASESLKNIDKTTDQVNIFQALKPKLFAPLPLLSTLTQTLDESVRVTELTWYPGDPKNANGAAAAAPAAAPMPMPSVDANGALLLKSSLELTLEFREFSTPSKTFVQKAENLRARMAEAFKVDISQVQYPDLPGTYKENETMQIGSDKTAPAKPAAEPGALISTKMVIRGIGS